MLNRITKGVANWSKTMTKICGKKELVLLSTVYFATYCTVHSVDSLTTGFHTLVQNYRAILN